MSSKNSRNDRETRDRRRRRSPTPHRRTTKFKSGDGPRSLRATIERMSENIRRIEDRIWRSENKSGQIKTEQKRNEKCQTGIYEIMKRLEEAIHENRRLQRKLEEKETTRKETTQTNDTHMTEETPVIDL